MTETLLAMAVVDASVAGLISLRGAPTTDAPVAVVGIAARGAPVTWAWREGALR